MLGTEMEPVSLTFQFNSDQVSFCISLESQQSINRGFITIFIAFRYEISYANDVTLSNEFWPMVIKKFCYKNE